MTADSYIIKIQRTETIYLRVDTDDKTLLDRLAAGEVRSGDSLVGEVIDREFSRWEWTPAEADQHV